jgi:hypothetical protein
VNEDGTKEHIVDNWRASGDPCRRTDKYFKGKTVFKLSSKPNGSRLEGKQSTLPVVEPKKKDTFTSRQTITFLAPAVKTLQPQHFATEIVQRNFRRMLVEFGGDKADEKSALEAHKKAVVQQLQVLDPTTGQPYVHDIWIELPTFWIRIHYVQRDRQFSPKDQELPGLGDEQFTMIVDSEAQEVWLTPPAIGDFLVTFYFTHVLEQLSFQRKTWRSRRFNLKASLTLRLRSSKDFQDPRVPLKMKYLSTI